MQPLIPVQAGETHVVPTRPLSRALAICLTVILRTVQGNTKIGDMTGRTRLTLGVSPPRPLGPD